MTRHGRNATANSVYTYHERKKDAKASGWGSLKERLGKDSLNEFDCCCLTLQPAKDPVLTPDGFLFDKQAILEYVIHGKKELARKMKEYEKALAEIQGRDHRKLEEKHQEAVQKLKEGVCATSPSIHTSRAAVATDSTPSVSNMLGKKRKEFPSFWTPDNAGKKARLSEEDDLSGLPQKPDNKVYCPMSGKPLKMKDLIPVKFTPAPPDDTVPVNSRKARYVCAVTKDVLTSSVPCVLLKTSGCVITKEAYEKLVKKDSRDPINGATLNSSDVIELKRGGTGYAAVNDEELKAELARPAAQLQ